MQSLVLTQRKGNQYHRDCSYSRRQTGVTKWHLSQIIILIQNVDGDLTCSIPGGRVVLRVLLFVQSTAQPQAKVAM